MTSKIREERRNKIKMSNGEVGARCIPLYRSKR